MEMTYKIAPKLPFASRLAAGLVLAVSGIALQFAASGFLGVPLIFAGGLCFLANSFTNKPKDLGFEDWRPVSDREIDRITDNLRQSRKIKLPAYFSRGMAVFITIACLFLSFLSAVFFENGVLALVLIDALAFLGPSLYSGAVSVWVPAQLKMKMECFQAVLSQQRTEGVSITPYLRFDKNKEGKEIPEDVRLMLESKRHAEDLVGIQLQAAINNGEHGAVPYLYAVCLTRGKGPSFKKLSAMNIEGYEIEWKEPEEYGAVVVRQGTQAGGYHTTGEDCARLFKLCLKILDFAGQGS
jgi:hypothetical protein